MPQSLSQRVQKFHSKYDEDIASIVSAMDAAGVKNSRTFNVAGHEYGDLVEEKGKGKPSSLLKNLTNLLDIKSPKINKVLWAYRNSDGSRDNISLENDDKKGITIYNVASGKDEKLFSHIEKYALKPLKKAAFKLLEKDVNELTQEEQNTMLATRKLENILKEWQAGDYLENLLTDAHSYREEHKEEYAARNKEKNNHSANILEQKEAVDRKERQKKRELAEREGQERFEGYLNLIEKKRTPGRGKSPVLG